MTTTNLTPLTTADRSPLRGVLGLNAATSAAAGLVATIAPAAVTDLFDLRHDRADLIVRVVGIGLIVFAVEVAVTAARNRKTTIARDATLISIADLAWVVSTVVVLATVDLSTAGRLIAGVMGAGVAGFAALQLRLKSIPHETNNRMEYQP